MKKYNNILKVFSIFIFLIISTVYLHGQNVRTKNLDSLILAKSKSYIKTDLSAQGKIALSTEINYNPKNKSNFLNYRIQGNIQTNIFGFTTPVNFSYSNGRTVYGYDLNPVQLPSFNRLGFSPKYKDLTIHVGYRQMNFTKYTLSGHQFKGWGFEYQPENYYLAFMKGILKPAVLEDFTDISLIEPSFQRDAWAVKGGYESESLAFGFAFLKSIDDPNSIDKYEDFSRSISPRENAVIGFYGKKSLGENLIFDFDYAFSGLSYDIVNDPNLDITTQYTAYNYFGLFTTRNNSIYDKAMKSSLTYKFSSFDISYNYERVDPDFRTLGAFFFNNNFITRTAGVSRSFLEERLNVNVEGGIEKIAEPTEQQENTGRLIGSLHSKYKVNDRLSFTGKYSNLNNSNLIRKPSLQSSSIDSILQTQTKEKINFGSNIVLGEKKNKILNLSAGYQRGIIVDRDQFLTTRNNISRNAGVNLSISKEKTNHSLSYAIASITNNMTNIYSHNFSHNFTRPINEISNLSILTALNIINSESINSLTLQGEVSYDFQYQDIHKVTTSLSSQVGRSKSRDEVTYIFFLIFKVNYDIGFNYQYTKRKK
jgi:hypothetical protein